LLRHPAFTAWVNEPIPLRRAVINHPQGDTVRVPNLYRQLAPLSEAELHTILTNLDEAVRPGGQAAKRGRERTQFRVGEVAITVHQPAGGKGFFRAYTRDLSSSGMGLLFGGFLHQKTLVDVQLVTTMGDIRTIRGKVTWCQHVAGKLHGIGIEFQTPIEPRTFIDPTRMRKEEPRTATPVVTGTVLHLDEEEMDLELMRMHFRETAVQIVPVKKIQDVVAVLNERAVDLILCELNIGSETGEAAIKAIREAGYGGPLVVLTGEQNAERLKKVVTMGITGVIRKPYEPLKILRLVLDTLAKVEFSVTNEPIYSLLEGTMGNVEPVEKYVRLIAERRTQLRALRAGQDLAPVRQLCIALQSTANGYGFPLLADAARHALKRLETTGSLHESRDSLMRLEIVMSRLRMRSGDSAKTRPAA
jgi:CheY-like chemotaxis protein